MTENPDLRRQLDDAALDRARRARLGDELERRAAAEDATFPGVLADLADRRDHVLVTTVSGAAIGGRVLLVGHDLVVVEAPEGRWWLARPGVAMVRAAGRRAPGPVREPVDVHLVEALGRLADERPVVVLACTGGMRVVGRLGSVGRDLVTVRLDDGDECYVPSSAIESVFRSG